MTPLAEVTLERPIGQLRPDVTATTLNGEQIFIEVAVSHFVDPTKQQKAAVSGLPMVEFDLSGVLRDDFASLKRLLFEPSKHAHWIFHPDVERERINRLRQAQETLAAYKRNEEIKAQEERNRWASYRRQEELDQIQIARSQAKKAERIKKIEAFRKLSSRQKERKILQVLGVKAEQLPWFLNGRRDGAESFGVPGYVWQAGVYEALIRHAWRRENYFLRIDDVIDWLVPRFSPINEGRISGAMIGAWMDTLVAVGVMNKMPDGRYVVLTGSSVLSLLSLEVMHAGAYRQPYLWTQHWPAVEESRAVHHAFSVAFGASGPWRGLTDLEEWQSDRPTVDRFVSNRLTELNIFEPCDAERAMLTRFLVCAGFAQVADVSLTG